MKRIITWAIGLTLVAGLYAPGVAQAHVKDINTRLTLRVSDNRVEKRDVVRFSGVLKAKNRRCFRNQTIRITRNGNRFGTTSTNNRGKYSLNKKVRKAGRYRAVFDGFGPFGVHPHSHTCLPSSSKSVRIRIQR